VAQPDPCASWLLSDRLQLLAFEAELAHLPRSLIAALWEALDSLGSARLRGVQGGSVLVSCAINDGMLS
jgi:hypothetical protein